MRFRLQPTSVIHPACLIANIFVLTGNIGVQVRGRGRAGRIGWMQQPEGRWGWGQRSRGEEQGWRRGDERHDGGIEEEKGRDGDDGSTGERDKARANNTGK